MTGQSGPVSILRSGVKREQRRVGFDQRQGRQPQPPPAQPPSQPPSQTPSQHPPFRPPPQPPREAAPASEIRASDGPAPPPPHSQGQAQNPYAPAVGPAHVPVTPAHFSRPAYYLPSTPFPGSYFHPATPFPHAPPPNLLHQLPPSFFAEPPTPVVNPPPQPKLLDFLRGQGGSGGPAPPGPVCPQCEEAVPLSILDKHIRIHKSYTPLQCGPCDLYFYASCDVDLHKRTVHHRGKAKIISVPDEDLENACDAMRQQIFAALKTEAAASAAAAPAQPQPHPPGPDRARGDVVQLEAEDTGAHGGPPQPPPAPQPDPHPMEEEQISLPLSGAGQDPAPEPSPAPQPQPTVKAEPASQPDEEMEPNETHEQQPENQSSTNNHPYRPAGSINDTSSSRHEIVGSEFGQSSQLDESRLEMSLVNESRMEEEDEEEEEAEETSVVLAESTGGSIRKRTQLQELPLYSSTPLPEAQAGEQKGEGQSGAAAGGPAGGERSLRCSLCQLSLGKRSPLPVKHLMKEHLKRRRLRCGLGCGRTDLWTATRPMVEHFRTEHGGAAPVYEDSARELWPQLQRMMRDAFGLGLDERAPDGAGPRLGQGQGPGERQGQMGPQKTIQTTPMRPPQELPLTRRRRGRGPTKTPAKAAETQRLPVARRGKPITSGDAKRMRASLGAVGGAAVGSGTAAVPADVACKECRASVVNRSEQRMYHIMRAHIGRVIFSCRHCAFSSKEPERTKEMDLHMRQRHPTRPVKDVNDKRKDLIPDIQHLMLSCFGLKSTISISK